MFLCVFKEKRSKNEFFRQSLKTFLETHSSSSFHTSFVTPKVLLAPRKHYPQQLFIERFFRAQRACLSIWELIQVNLKSSCVLDDSFIHPNILKIGLWIFDHYWMRVSVVSILENFLKKWKRHEFKAFNLDSDISIFISFTFNPILNRTVTFPMSEKQLIKTTFGIITKYLKTLSC